MPRRAGWRPRIGAVLASALAAGLLLLPAAAVAQPGPSPVSLILNPNGTLLANLTVEIPNGTLLRYAIDGNFTPLLDALPISAANRSHYESEIALLEDNPFTAGDFGNRDGTVSSGEVTEFTRLAVQESAYLPSDLLTGGLIFSMTMDGQTPSAATIEALYLSGAVGPDTSSAPIEASFTTQYSFSLGGSSHTLELSWTLPPLVFSSFLDFDLTFLTPAGDSITGNSGFGSTSVHNDLFGFAPGKFSGELTPSGTGTASIEFGPAFPLGIILIVAVVVGAGALGLLLLMLRARRRRATGAESKPTPAPSGGAASPTSSSPEPEPPTPGQ
jgi:hypothetical protein